MASYVLLTDGSPESKQAIKILKEANIIFAITSFPTDEDLRPPVLFIPEGKCEGITCINSFVETMQGRS
jgi:hypothetical protein